jgi:hypothetical protein
MAIAADAPTPLSLPASLRPRGWGRYFDSVFMIGWLAIWLVGEVVVAALTVGTVISLIAVSLGLAAPASFPKTTDPGVAAGFLLFGLVWLTFWTIGGFAVATHLLRNLAGEDIVSLTPDALVVQRRAWIFYRTRTFTRADIRRITTNTKGAALAVYTGAKGIETVSSLGAPREREDLRAALAAALVLPDAATVKRLETQIPPPNWEAERRGVDLVLMRPPRRIRRQQAITMWIVTGLVSLGVIASLAMSIGSGGEIGFNTVAWVLSGLCVLLAAWIEWGGTEWMVQHGRLTHRLYFAGWTRERVFDGATLELSQFADSDGDWHHALHVSAPNEGDGVGRRKKKIASSLDAEWEMGWLGAWIAHQTGFPLDKDA